MALDLRVDELELAEAQRITRDPAVLGALEDDIARDARDAVWSLALRVLLVAVAGGTLGALVGAARWRPAPLGAAVGFGIAGGVTSATAATFDTGALARPRYSGLLTIAPTAVGDVRAVVTRFGEYRAQLTELVGNVVTIDAVVDTGDITDWGTEPEGRLLERIGGLDVPYVWVRGNHHSAATHAAVAAQPRAVVLDGRSAVVAGLRIWGTGDTRHTPDKGRPTGREAGGAGLRGLQAEAPEPLTASVLYFDRGTRRLVAYDRITVAGFGGSGARVERHIPSRSSPNSTTTSQISR